jgi:hypothetical protein
MGREPAPAEVGKALRLSPKRLRIVTQAIHVKTLMNSPEPLNGNEDEKGLAHLLEGRSRDAANLLGEADSRRYATKLRASSRGLEHVISVALHDHKRAPRAG